MYEIFEDLLKQKGITAYRVAKDTGINYQIFSDWKRGKSKPKHDKILKIAKYLGVSDMYLEGLQENNDVNVTTKLPILGYVPCGIPIEAVEDIIGYVNVSPRIDKEHFGLVAKGNSMFPKIEEGDLLIVHYTPNVSSGKIAIVKVNGEDATCKKIILNENGITLIPLNNQYDPVFYNREQIEKLPVSIIGEVEEVRRYL